MVDVDLLGFVERVDTTEEELERAGREHESRSIPPDIVEGMEVVSHLWDSCCDDRSVLHRVSELCWEVTNVDTYQSDQKDGEQDCDHNNDPLSERREFRLAAT